MAALTQKEFIDGDSAVKHASNDFEEDMKLLDEFMAETEDLSATDEDDLAASTLDSIHDALLDARALLDDLGNDPDQNPPPVPAPRPEMKALRERISSLESVLDDVSLSLEEIRQQITNASG